jgi:hypothetical protein
MKKTFLFIVFALAMTNVFGAGPKYWVGRGTNANWSTVANWASTSGGSDVVSVPVVGDDVYFDANSGTNVIAYCLGASPVLNSLNATGCNVTFAIVPTATLSAAAGAITTTSKTISLTNTTGIAAGQFVYVQSGEGAIPFATTVASFASNSSVTLNTNNPYAGNPNNPAILAFVPTTATSITTKTVTLDNANVKACFTVTVNGGIGNGTSTYDFSFLNNSTWTQCPFANGQTITLGSGSTFYMTGNSATNYFDGNSGGYITFNTSSPLNVYFNQNTISGNGSFGGVPASLPQVNGWGAIANTKGTITIKNSVATQRINQSASNSQTLVLGDGVTFNLTGNGSCFLGNVATSGSIDASNTTCKVIVSSGNAGVLNAIGTIFRPGTAATPINYFELNRNSTFVPTAPMFIKNLVLTLGTIANSTTNTITVVDGGTITRTAGKLMLPPVYGTAPAEKVNITIAGSCTADNEILGTMGKIGTLTVNPGITYSLNSPALAPGYYISAFNGGNGYGGTAPTPTLNGGTLTGTANVLTSPLYNGYLYSLTSTATGVYSSLPTVSFTAPATPSAWAGGTSYVINAVVSSGSNYYVCTTAYTGSATQTAPTGTGSAKDAINDGRAKWAYIGNSLTTATATLSLLPTSITVNALNLLGKLSYPNSATPVTLNVTSDVIVSAAGTLDLGIAQGTDVTHYLTVGGNITNSGSIVTNITKGKLDVSMNGSVAQTIYSTSTFNNLTINNLTGVSLGSSTTVAGSLALSAGSLSIGANTLTLSGISPTLTTGSIDASNAGAVLAFTNASAITLPAGLINGSISSLTVNGTGGIILSEGIKINGTLNLTAGNIANSQAYNITFGDGTNPVTIVRTAGSISGYYPVFSSVANLTYNNTLATTTGYEISIDASKLNNLTVNNAGGVIISGDRTVNGTLELNAGTLTIGTTVNPRTLTYKGSNIICNGGFLNAGVIGSTSGGSGITFANTSALSLPANLFSGNIYKMTVNGTGGITLLSPITVENLLTLTNGKVSLGDNDLTIGVAGSISGGSATSYVVTDGAGKLNLPVAAATATILPIGTSTSSYDPATVTATDATAFSAKVSATLSGTPASGTFYNPREWTLTPLATSSTVISLTPSTDAVSGTYGIIGVSDGAGSYANTYVTPVTGTYTGTFANLSKPFVTGKTDTATGIDGAAKSSLNVYAQGKKMMINGLSVGDAVSVFKLNGQQVKTYTANSSQIIDQLAKGAYLVKVKANTVVNVSKIIVQ